MKHIQTALVLYPHQLFAPEHLPKVDLVYLVEEPLFFGVDQQYPLPLHKQKLVLHRASMRRYIEEVLWQNDIDVEYIELDDVGSTADVLVRAQQAGAELVYVFDPTDFAIDTRIKKALEGVIETPFELRVLPTPSFMLKATEVRDYLGDKDKHKFADFYQWQRERFNILIDKNYKPVGGKWSYDVENRKALPKDHTAPGFNGYGDNKYVEEAKKWVDKRFTGNPGSYDEFMWPTSHDEAAKWLDEFFRERFEDFGAYEDAMDGAAVFLYHSGISAPLNIGLLTPQQVVDAALEYNEKNPVNLPSLEGFIRQVIGWREYVRGLYITQSVPMRTANGLNQTRTLSSQWWDGTTGIPPLDDVITKVNKHAYAHHIERLMIVGNLMLLCEIKPEEVYKWFASLFIDAYDWVMVPNVYGMSQFSDLGSMMTKPYISGSNYILNMSHYDKDIWCDVWDGLFWGFVDRNKELLAKNPRTSMMVKQLGKLNADRKRIIGYRAQDFLTSIS
ncbi:MAG: cryptochrome/photolyase family protein [Candidatus Saccharimonadales bacterium]